MRSSWLAGRGAPACVARHDWPGRQKIETGLAVCSRTLFSPPHARQTGHMGPRQSGVPHFWGTSGHSILQREPPHAPSSPPLPTQPPPLAYHLTSRASPLPCACPSRCALLLSFSSSWSSFAPPSVSASLPLPAPGPPSTPAPCSSAAAHGLSAASAQLVFPARHSMALPPVGEVGSAAQPPVGGWVVVPCPAPLGERATGRWEGKRWHRHPLAP